MGLLLFGMFKLVLWCIPQRRYHFNVRNIFKPITVDHPLILLLLQLISTNDGNRWVRHWGYFLFSQNCLSIPVRLFEFDWL